MCQSCVINTKSGHSELFLSKTWYLFSYVGFYLEEFVVNMFTSIFWPFFKKKNTLTNFQVCKQDFQSVGGHF